MSEGRRWFRRFLGWFRGDELDTVLGGEDAPLTARPTIIAEVGGVGGSAGTGPSGGGETVSGVGTAVAEMPSPAVIRRALIDGDVDALDRDEPATVDEDYILSETAGDKGQTPREEEAPTPDTRSSTLDGQADGVTLTREPPRAEEGIIAKVEAGVSEVSRALMNVSTAVVQQNELLEGMVRTVSDVPAVMRAQGVYLETITRQLETQNARSAELAGRLKDLPTLLGGLPEQGRAQLEFLQQIAVVLEGDADRSNAVVRSVNALGAALETISETGRAQVRILHELDRNQKDTLDALKDSTEHHAKRYAWLLFLMWTVTVATVGGIAFLVYYVTRHLPVV